MHVFLQFVAYSFAGAVALAFFFATIGVLAFAKGPAEESHVDGGVPPRHGRVDGGVRARRGRAGGGDQGRCREARLDLPQICGPDRPSSDGALGFRRGAERVRLGLSLIQDRPAMPEKKALGPVLTSVTFGPLAARRFESLIKRSRRNLFVGPSRPARCGSRRRW